MKRHIFGTAVLVLAMALSSRLGASEEETVAPRTEAGLTITSKPTASPKSPAVLADTTFTAAATGSGTVTYSWNFGDGTPAANGASVIHDFFAPGTYTVVLTVNDASNIPQTASLTVVVTDAVTSPKLYITLDFKKAGNDTIFLTGQIRTAPNTKLEGQTFAVNVGGVTQTFTMNKFGQATVSPGNIVKFFVKPQFVTGVELSSTFFVNLKGNFQSTLAASSNLTDRNANRDPVKVKVTVTFQGIPYTVTISQTFIAHEGLRGITR